MNSKAKLMQFFVRINYARILLWNSSVLCIQICWASTFLNFSNQLPVVNSNEHQQSFYVLFGCGLERRLCTGFQP